MFANLSDLPVTVRVCTSVAEAVRGADIVTTVTADKAKATIITPDMVEPGMHINAVGGDCPGKTDCTQMCCVAPPCLWNMPRRHVWRAISSKCLPTLR